MDVRSGLFFSVIRPCFSIASSQTIQMLSPLPCNRGQPKPAVAMEPQTLQEFTHMNPDVKQTASGSKGLFFPHSIPLAESRNLDADPRLYSQASSINSSGSDQRPELTGLTQFESGPGA